MKNISSLRTLFLLSFIAAAVGSTVQAANLDASIARRLGTSGEVAVRAAGPYVQPGSYRIWVSSHLGRPTAVLADGTWLYRGFQVDDSSVGGTLAVSFQHGRVTSLKLLSGLRVAALTSPKPQTTLLASR